MTFLDKHPVLASSDLHEMRAIMSSMTNDQVDVVGKKQEIDANINAVSFADMELIHISYGDVQTEIRSPAGPDTLLLAMLTNGAATARHQGVELEATMDRGIMRDMSVPLFSVQKNLSGFAVPLALETLKKHARAMIGEEADLIEPKFDAQLDFTTANGNQVRHTLHYIAEALNGPLPSTVNSIILDSFKDLLVTNILTCLPNSYSDLLSDAPKSGAVTRYVKRARDYIHAHAHTSITMEILAAHAGCGYRNLQLGFAETHGMTPMAYLKNLRLVYVRREFIAADKNVNINDVALKWGFRHMGRFAQDYRLKYGELPSQTLRLHF